MHTSPFQAIASGLIVGALGFAPFAAAIAETPPASATSTSTSSAEPELFLTLSVELSTEDKNAAALVGRAVRTELFAPGDKLDISQRLSQLRKELGINYSAPVSTAGFGMLSHELLVSETSRLISKQAQLTTSQASYRNLWSRRWGVGVGGVGYALEALMLENQPDSAPYLREFIARHGRSSHNFALIGYWAADRRDADLILPRGHLDRLSVEWGTPLGSLSYLKLEYKHESYFSLSPRVAAGFNATVGALRGLNGDLTPLTKRYFGGGIGAVRGYEASSVSPVDVSGAGIGANRKIQGTAEVLWRAFSVGETPMILSAFYDRGRFFDAGASNVVAQSDVRAASYGLGVSMPVRIGLVRFYFAKPTDESLRTKRFQFDARANWK